MAGSHFNRKTVSVTGGAPAISSKNPLKGISKGRVNDISPINDPKARVSPFLAPRARVPIVVPQFRRWTVGYRHRYAEHRYTYPHAGRLRPEPPPVPFLPLQGRWLQQAGFAIGTPVRILVTPGRLVLEVDQSR